jgi:prepilin-type processing-associated H-X9-DG protein
LVIILAVILILAALLFPAFSKVRESGRRAVCLNNLKQFGVAIQQYVSDNDGFYPVTIKWGDKVMPYIKNSQIFSCPDGITDGSYNASPSIKSDYWLNSLWMYTVPNLPLTPSTPPPPFNKHTHEAVFVKAGEVLLMAEGNKYYPGKTVFSNGRESSWPTHHSEGANYLFLDGHVRWCLPQTLADITEHALPPMKK